MNARDRNDDFKGTVLITGATSGIGSEIAMRFARRGWTVLGHYHSSEKKARRLSNAIVKEGALCRLYKADLRHRNQLTRFCRKIGKLRIDTLINNAGTYVVSKHFTRLRVEDLTDAFMVNTFSPILLSAAVINGMKERRFGRIVSISSIAAKYGGSRLSLHYGCSKSAVEGMTRTLAREAAAENVLVNTVRPGVIDTDFHKRYPKDMKKRVAMIPVGKMGEPGDIADVVFYLGSARNRFITNEIVTVAGGE